MVRCHCWVPLDRVPLDRVPLLGAIARSHVVRCHCWVPLGGCTRWWIGRGAVAGCHWIGCHGKIAGCHGRMACGKVPW